jgi:hypothetical protein
LYFDFGLENTVTTQGGNAVLRKCGLEVCPIHFN